MHAWRSRAAVRLLRNAGDERMECGAVVSGVWVGIFTQACVEIRTRICVSCITGIGAGSPRLLSGGGMRHVPQAARRSSYSTVCHSEACVAHVFYEQHLERQAPGA